ncbi:MAG: sigma 54-interacting transcriptional regulator [Myxococcales bacterium]|nr:sigma 54-interacting transcriptional regulator [Myxococcales bacterium]
MFGGTSSWLYPLPASGDVVIGRSESANLRIDDASVSRQHARLVIDGDGVTLIDLGSHNGTFVNKARVSGRRVLQPDDVITIHKTTLILHTAGVPTKSPPAEHVAAEGSVRAGPGVTLGARRVIVADPAVVRIYDLIERLAPVDLPVLITGETGSGKELVATSIHALSSRASKPLISLNCAALHDSLIESELFGHEKGAFSGAVAARAGLIEAASGSTLFLDEVGELAPAVQAKLLRVLEVHRVTRVGDTREREVDVRIVAATNRDLEADVAAGRFRRDLYFRLSAATLHLPPLRQRLRELPLMASAFLDDACRRNGRPLMRISEGALDVLLEHSWPGNVRELKNLMQYLAATITSDIMLADHVQERIGGVQNTPMPRPAPIDARQFRPLADELRELEITRISQALEATGGNQTRAAQLLAMPVRTFFEKAKQYGLTPKKKRYDH